MTEMTYLPIELTPAELRAVRKFVQEAQDRPGGRLFDICGLKDESSKKLKRILLMALSAPALMTAGMVANLGMFSTETILDRRILFDGFLVATPAGLALMAIAMGLMPGAEKIDSVLKKIKHQQWVENQYRDPAIRNRDPAKQTRAERRRAIAERRTNERGLRISPLNYSA